MPGLLPLPAAAAIPLCLMVCAAPASAQAPAGADTDRVQIELIFDLRARYEIVDQSGLEADALTVRARAGVEAKSGPFSLLAEAEGTAAPIADYNAFPFAVSSRQRRPQFAVVADPWNLELNRFQLKFQSAGNTLTLGRQRINMDDQRWVGSVGWRQNEQTFDAIRGEAMFGPVEVDLTYSISQRTIFGEHAGPRTSVGGDFLFAGVSSKLGPLQGKLFAYLLDYDERFFLSNSSQTYGGILSGSVPFGGSRKLSLRASYARQSDYGQNPFRYAANYWAFEGGTTLAGFTLAAGWERLGSNNGRSVQTPMATLHKFNGWADLFLTTPPAGLDDAYLSIGRKFDGARLLSGLEANLTFHKFDSAIGDVKYGTEWDASIGWKLGAIGMLIKYANYNAKMFGTDTRKMWLQAQWGF